MNEKLLKLNDELTTIASRLETDQGVLYEAYGQVLDNNGIPWHCSYIVPRDFPHCEVDTSEDIDLRDLLVAIHNDYVRLRTLPMRMNHRLGKQITDLTLDNIGHRLAPLVKGNVFDILVRDGILIVSVRDPNISVRRVPNYKPLFEMMQAAYERVRQNQKIVPHDL